MNVSRPFYLDRRKDQQHDSRLCIFSRSEYLYVIFELIVGLICFATVLGIIANIVTNVSAARKDFQGKAIEFFVTTANETEEHIREGGNPILSFFPHTSH